jgi:hypothetical protein
MVAVFSIPGSQYHTWKRFQSFERKEAEMWLSKQRDLNPYCTDMSEIMSEKKAAKVKWLSGEKVYPVRDIIRFYEVTNYV